MMLHYWPLLAHASDPFTYNAPKNFVRKFHQPCELAKIRTLSVSFTDHFCGLGMRLLVTLWSWNETASMCITLWSWNETADMCITLWSWNETAVMCITLWSWKETAGSECLRGL